MTREEAFARWADENPFSPNRIKFWDEYCDIRDDLPMGTTRSKISFGGEMDFVRSQRRWVKEDAVFTF